SRSEQEGITRLIVDVAADDPTAAAEALDFLRSTDGTPPSSPQDGGTETEDEEEDDTSSEMNPLAYPGLASVEVRI
ncbi:MAG: hypothetical protein ACPHQP_03245, partial [Longimicrobiales bacterium]